MLYTTKQVADILGVSESLIKLRRRENKLTFTEAKGSLFLFSKDDITSFAQMSKYNIGEFDFYSREELIELVKRMREEKLNG